MDKKKLIISLCSILFVLCASVIVITLPFYYIPLVFVLYFKNEITEGIIEKLGTSKNKNIENKQD